jgi:hypothetical protein
MRKVMIGILLVGLMFGVCFAGEQLSKTITMSNTGTAGNTTYINNTVTFIPGVHRVTSFTVMPSPGAVTTPLAGLYDATTAANITVSDLMGEVQAANQTSQDKIFPYPKTVKRGLAIQAAANTTVIVEYTR